MPTVPDGEHPATGRIRALGRVLLCLFIWFVLQTLLTLPYLFSQDLSGSEGTASLEVPTFQTMTVSAVIGTLATLGAVAWMTRRRGLWESLRDFDLSREAFHPREVALGFALGPALFGGVWALCLALGWVQEVSFQPAFLAVLLGFFVAVLTAFSEEILMRGYVLQTLLPFWGLRTSLLLQAVVFAVLHGFNPGVSPMAFVNLALAGLLFGYAWKASRSLWLPVALHLGWNFAQGPLFGFPVSGISFPSFLDYQLEGPLWATGGAFGPEAGVLGLAATLLIFLVIYLWEQQRGRRRAEPSAQEAYSGEPERR